MQVVVSRKIVPITISPLDSCRGRRNAKNICAGFYQQHRYFTNSTAAVSAVVAAATAVAVAETIINVNK
jgi:hypothetical protein